ncbi:MAG: hypothetical protein IJ825_09560 [Oscillospiraceae bacterium]|nr:hypothetical protein [Oscillospiraceae bacterium]
MNSLVLIGAVLLGCIGLAIAAALLYTPPQPVMQRRLTPFAVLPVPEDTPAVRAFLHELAAQVAWMDASVLRSVILVYPEKAPAVQALCEEMAQNYEVFMAMSFAQVTAVVEKERDAP